MIPPISRYDFIVDTYAPVGHAAERHLRWVFARTPEDAERVLKSESFAFGLKEIHLDMPTIKDDDANLQL